MQAANGDITCRFPQRPLSARVNSGQAGQCGTAGIGFDILQRTIQIERRPVNAGPGGEQRQRRLFTDVVLEILIARLGLGIVFTGNHGDRRNKAQRGGIAPVFRRQPADKRNIVADRLGGQPGHKNDFGMFRGKVAAAR